MSTTLGYIDLQRVQYALGAAMGNEEISSTSYKHLSETARKVAEMQHELPSTSSDEQYIVTFWNGERYVKVMSTNQFWMVRKFSKAGADAFIGMYSDQAEKMKALRYRGK